MELLLLCVLRGKGVLANFRAQIGSALTSVLFVDSAVVRAVLGCASAVVDGPLCFKAVTFPEAVLMMYCQKSVVFHYGFHDS